MTTLSVRNIRHSFEGCRQIFKGYKLTFVYALLESITYRLYPKTFSLF